MLPQGDVSAAERPSATAAAPVQSSPDAPSAPVAQPATPEAVAAAATTPEPSAAVGEYKDGTYSGWGRCRHGRIEASVVIEGGRIVSSEITQCLTRYSCSWIVGLPPQVVARQSADVDYVSGATESADAFYGAVAEALAKAK